MNWSPERILAFLNANTQAALEILPTSGRPRFCDLVRLHWKRGGLRDHLLMAFLVPFTLGLSAWIWQRYYGSCCFAGYLDPVAGRVGCLIHPLRAGEPDLRRHAFPLVPTLGCNRELRCPMLNAAQVNLKADLITISQTGFTSLRTGQKTKNEAC